MAGAEVFWIPVEGGSIVYAPLKRLAFVANRALAAIVHRLHAGEALVAPSAETMDAVRFVERVGLLGPDEAIPADPSSARYAPTSAILFLTNRCNLRCVYCYADGGTLPHSDMPLPLAIQAIDVACRNAADLGLDTFDVGFHGGGEPTLNWRVLTACVAHARRQPLRAAVTMSTNGVFTPTTLAFVLDHFDGLSLSFDGVPDVQNRQRPRLGGAPSFPIVMRTIEALDKRRTPYGIRMTATRRSAPRLAEIVRFLAERTGARQVQIEPSFDRGRATGTAVLGGDVGPFIRGFLEAHDVASSHGIDLLYSGARLDVLTQEFCRAPHDALVVLPTGEISACFEVHNRDHVLAADLLIGSLTEGRVHLDEERWQRCGARPARTPSHCADCFCRYHCAGDCLSRTFAREAPDHFAPSPRCRITREITKQLLLRRLQAAGGMWSGADAECVASTEEKQTPRPPAAVAAP